MIRDLWYKNAIIYSLNVETFLDSNGDGTGDFEGLSRALDYLQGLGVTCVWLAPFQRSPRRDDGYDISDYYQVDPQFGTLGDFVDFTHEANQRGIRVSHLMAACVDEFKENEDLPNTTNPDDWARISGKKGERIVYIRTLISGKQGAEAGRAIDTVANTGQYL